MVRRLAIAVIALAALSGCRDRPADALSAAVSELQYRPLEGRLAGFPYANSPSLRRVTHASALAEANVQKVASRLFLSRDSDEVRHRAAILMGDVGMARALLQRVTSRGTATAQTWSDYAAVLYADAAPDDALQLATALAATDHAMELAPGLPEALFNRALLLEALAFRADAATA